MDGQPVKNRHSVHKTRRRMNDAPFVYIYAGSTSLSRLPSNAPQLAR